MINGHGDDIHNYDGIRINFSSNIYAGFDHQGLFEHLSKSMSLIANYPEPTPDSLEKRIAEEEGIKPGNVMVTNGATEAIYMIAETFNGCESVIPYPTFSEYSDACRIRGNKSLIINQSLIKIWWLCIPNNPTGQVMPKKELIDKIVANQEDVFVVDASYAAYTKEDVITAKEVVEYSNVIMLRSMTKDYGVPGLRLGYTIGNSRLLDKVREYRMPWSVNALAIEAGHYLLSHKDEYRIPVDDLNGERIRMEKELHKMGVSTSHSDSHMLLCQLPKGTAHELKEYLATNHGILIRDASNFKTLPPQHFRIAVQTREQNDELLKALGPQTPGPQAPLKGNVG